ncbi:MAG: sigma factor, partial [Mucinivorans sp.]
MKLDQFNKCVDSYADNLYRFVLGIVRSRALAEDIMQDSYIKLWENRQKIMVGKEKSYLFTVAY